MVVINPPAPRLGATGDTQWSPQSGAAENKVHDQVYDALAEALIQGRIAPLESVSLRSLATQMNVSPMPVREAVRRLITEKALELQPSNKRLRVPDLSEDRLRQLMQAREWVEPELARRAAGRLSRDTLRQLREDSATLMGAMRSGDIAAYMQANQRFHFTIYAGAGAELFYDMARSLWLQAGPFMRVVFGRVGTFNLLRDHHPKMIEALETGDGDGAHAAMTADIHDGMDLMLVTMKTGMAQAQPKKRRRAKAAVK